MAKFIKRIIRFLGLYIGPVSSGIVLYLSLIGLGYSIILLAFPDKEATLNDLLEKSLPSEIEIDIDILINVPLRVVSYFGILTFTFLILKSIKTLFFQMKNLVVAIYIARHGKEEYDSFIRSISLLISIFKRNRGITWLARGFTDSMTARMRERAKRVKQEYPGLSVVGVFANRLEDSQVKATNFLFIVAAGYIFSSIITNLIAFDLKVLISFIICYVGISINKTVTRYRIKKGYYLNNESDTRELLDFIRDNADDIDFTGPNKKIVSDRDLEDIVLEQMRQVPST